jgi:hypothetical protein
VAHFLRSRFVDELDDCVVVLLLVDGVLELVDREELFELLEPDDEEPLLDDRSSLRRSSPRRSSPRCSSSLRDRLLRQSPRLRSPKRPRSRS